MVDELGNSSKDERMTSDNRAPKAPIVKNGKRPILVFGFSLIPGAGHMYMGLMNRGLHLMTLFFGTLYLSNLLPAGAGMNELWTVTVAPIVWFYSFFDSLRISGRLNRGETVYDEGILADNLVFNPTAWGIALIVVGGLSLLVNLGRLNPIVFHWIRMISAPVILIALGCYLLWRERHFRSPRT
jgi:hypothetical protein